jgi:hypothetical protein
VKYYLGDDSKYTGTIKRSTFSMGVFYRGNDALIISTMFEYLHFAYGFSYDINTSKLVTASKARGGAEFFIRFNSLNPFLFQTNKSKFL